MPGTYQYDVEIKSNVAKLLSDMKQVQDRLDTVEGREYTIKLNIDEKKLSNVISNLEKMLDSLGKGTGDFKQFENLSKELSSIVSEIQSLSKAFGKVDDSGAKTLLSSIQNIDKSLSELSQNILNINKNMSNMGGNTSGAVKQVENITNESKKAASALEDVAKAQEKVNGQKTNISSGLDSNISKYQEIVSLVKEYYELSQKIQTPKLSYQKRSEDYDKIDAYLLSKKTSHNIVAGQIKSKYDREKSINDTYHDMSKGINEGKDFAVKAMKSAIQSYWSNVTEMPSDDKLLSSRKIDRSYKGSSKEEYIIPKKYQDMEKSVIQETIAMNKNNIAYEEERKQIEANNSALKERMNLIRNTIKGYDKNPDYNGEYRMGLSLKSSDKGKTDIFSSTSSISQEEMLQEICNMLGVEIPKNADKAKEAIKEVASATDSTEQKKDAFPDKDVSASVEKIADGFKEAKQETEEATESAKDYVRTISQVGEWNVDSKVSVVKERNDGQLETWNYDAKRGKKDITYDKDGNINYGDPIITTISNYKQLEQTIVKADDKLRDLRKALEDIKEINPNASTKNIEKQIQYQKEYISLLEQTVKVISQGDEYFLNEQQIIDARKKATTEYDLKQGTKSDISNAKQSAKANEQAIRQEQKLTNELRKQEEQARKTALSYTESASKKLSNAISKYSYGDSSDATAMMKQMNRGLSNFGDLSNIESNIKNFDSVIDSIITDLKRSHEDALSSLNSEIKAEETMQKQKDAFNKSNLNAIDMEIKKREEETKAFSNSLKAQMESQQQAESQMSKFGNTLSKYQTKTGGYNATIARFNDGGWTSDEYLKNVQAVRDAVKQYATLLDNIKTNQNGIASDEDIQNLNKYEKKIKETIATVTNMSAAEKGYSQLAGQKEIDKINKILRENSAMSSEAKAKIKAYKQELVSGNPSASLEKIHGEIMKIVNAEELAGRAGRSFFDTLKNSGFHQIAAQMAGMFGVYDIINVVRQGINTVRELDTAMTEVRKVSNATETQYASFRDTVSSTAKEIATTNKELLNSSADFLRLGYSLEQTSDLAKNATLFVNVGDGVDITEATEDMITAMKAFDIKAEDSIKIVDDYNQIGNQFALSASDIGEAMKRSASALETGNNSFEQSIGLITAMNEIVQNSENTGNSLKVLSLRLRGAKAELEDLQEDTDGLCDSTSKLREQIKSLTGVDIMLDDNTFKSTTDIIKELGAVWDKLSDSSQAATLELIAGKSRANNVAALLKNYQKIDEVMESLGDAEGSAMRENEAIVDSINGRIKVLSATAEEFWQNFINTDLVKELVSLTSDLLNILTKIVNIGNGAGTLGLIGAGAGIFKFIKNFDWVFKPYIKLSNSF